MPEARGIYAAHAAMRRHSASAIALDELDGVSHDRPEARIV